MDKKLIERIIKTNNEPYPEITFNNPLIDRKVANSLSKSFIKILKISDQNSKTNNSLRLTMLQNIRNLCQVEPEGHFKVDDSFTDHLTGLYEKHFSDMNTGNEEQHTARRVDNFLVRTLKGLDVTTTFESSVSPEVIQALINLNLNGVYLDNLLKGALRWNTNDPMYSSFIKDLWNNHCENTITPCVLNDISIKMKWEIEIILLNICKEVLCKSEIIVPEIFKSNTEVADLIKKCSISSECFQICCSVLNFIFIMTNFHSHIQKLIQVFIELVKQYCPHVTFSVLYPIHLTHIVVLLDFETELLTSPLRDMYVLSAVKCLSKLQSESENELILLLSHFPKWFDIFFDHVNVVD